MSELYDFLVNPELESPVLVVVLEGWIDAGLGASAALGAIAGARPLDTIAVFDTDALLDHRARRPTMRIDDGIQTGLMWPTIEMKAGSDPRGHDVLLLMGAEPDHSWRAFSADVVALAVEMGCRMVVGLGAYPAPTPHTRPTQVVATTAWPDLARQVGFVHGRVDVPAGVQAAIEEHAHDVGLPSIGLWAQVPHYASAMPYPAAGEALVEALNEVADLGFDTGRLGDEAASARIRLDGLIAESSEHQQLVRQLEAQVDAAAGTDGGGLPSGEELAEELERYLRDQDGP